MKLTLIKNFKNTDGNFAENPLLIRDGIIADCDFRGDIPESAEIVDADGCYLLPSFIELHAHGGGGFDFIDSTAEAFNGIMDTHLSHGVGLICPTLVTCRYDSIINFIKLSEGFSSHPMFGGIHLEGPFLSPVMCGAQNPELIISPTAQMIDELAEYAPLISRITAASEVPGALELALRMTKCGVCMSVGHSNADAQTVFRAADAGFNLITHLYSSTSRRSKFGSYVLGGIEETALIDDRFTAELIGDGHHVCRESLLLTLKCKGEERVCIVSDAMRHAGLPEMPGITESYIGAVSPENRVIVEDGVAKLPDRSSFAGSVAVGDTMIQALCGRYGLPLAIISRLMSETPARILGLQGERGRIANGLSADITLLDLEYRTKSVFLGGEKVY